MTWWANFHVDAFVTTCPFSKQKNHFAKNFCVSAPLREFNFVSRSDTMTQRNDNLNDWYGDNTDQRTGYTHAFSTTCHCEGSEAIPFLLTRVCLVVPPRNDMVSKFPCGRFCHNLSFSKQKNHFAKNFWVSARGILKNRFKSELYNSSILNRKDKENIIWNIKEARGIALKQK